MKYSSDSWTSYWEQGSLTSLPVDFKVNYDRDVEQFWYSVFSDLGEQALVLDVCTGNGAIACLAAKYSLENERQFSIIATDGANVRPELVSKTNPGIRKYLQEIKFEAGVLLEDLTLSEGNVDLITSQYGIEYCLSQHTAQKLVELLKVGGEFVAVTHSAKTPIADITKNDYHLLDSVNFFTRVKKLVKNDSSQKEYQIFFKEVHKELERSLLSKVSPVLKPLVEACQFVLRASSEEFRGAKKQLEDFLRRFLHGRQRVLELLSVHKRMIEEPNWYKPLCEAGLVLEQSETLYLAGKNPVGDYYRFRKA